MTRIRTATERIAEAESLARAQVEADKGAWTERYRMPTGTFESYLSQRLKEALIDIEQEWVGKKKVA